MGHPDYLQHSFPRSFKKMEQEGLVAEVSQPTDWVNSRVVSSGGEKIRTLTLVTVIKQ